jgi:uncharacterized lipoprotein YddW (UPF0748 family)
VSRLSVAFPQVRKYFIDSFRETVSRGCDGVCLVFCRGWPLVLYEKPIAAEYKRRTGRSIVRAKPFDRELTKIRCEIVTDFIREIRAAVTDAAGGREVKILTLPLATPGENLKAGFDCRAWVKEGLVEVLCPYPYSFGCDLTEIDVPAWRKVVAGTPAQLLPILNRASARSGADQLAKAERWLKEGVDGFSFWDLDGFMIYPEYRLLAYHLASREGRRRLKRVFKDFPVRHRLDMIDGLAVDRFHPGWNV